MSLSRASQHGERTTRPADPLPDDGPIQLGQSCLEKEPAESADVNIVSVGRHTPNLRNKPTKLRSRLVSAYFSYFLCGWGDGGECCLSVPLLCHKLNTIPFKSPGRYFPVSHLLPIPTTLSMENGPDLQAEYHLTYSVSSLLFVGTTVGCVLL